MTDEKLTDEQAEEMLKKLSMHFNESVQPVSRYCNTIRTWGTCIGDRARRLQAELFPQLYEYNHPEHEAQRKEYDHAKMRATLQDLMPVGLSFLPKEFAASVVATTQRDKTPREHRIDELFHFEEAAHQVERTFLAIDKSNLLARLLYGGEKLRTKMCPEHKGVWSGIEWSDTVCPHKCQLTGWIQEEADQGKPLPGVQALQLVPTGNAPGEVTMIRDVDGQVLGKAVLQEIPKPKKPDVVVSGNALASVAAALAGSPGRTAEEEAYDEILASVVIKDGHRQMPPTQEVHEHDGVRLYTVTTIASSQRYGGTRTPAVCSTFESAKAIVEQNKGDIFEHSYQLAVIEAVAADWLYGGMIDEQYWYAWKGDAETGGYVPIERPKAYEGSINIGGIG